MNVNNDLVSNVLGGVVVRAIDLGYGNVKLTTQHKLMRGKIDCEQFPSSSPVAGEKILAAGVVKSRDTVVVRVNGMDYEVGRDVALAEKTFTSSILDKDFCLSDAYLARLLGALYYMMGSEKGGDKFFPGNTIGLLAVGLPVSGFQRQSLQLELKKRLTGKHSLPQGRDVEIKNVLVLPQPLGALFEFAFENDMMEKMSVQNTLIIDIGFFTFDWLMSAGLKTMDQRSGSVNFGMSAVILAIAEAAKKKNNWSTEIGQLVRILEDHFRHGKAFNVYGKDYDVSDYAAAARPIINEAVASLTSSVGDGVDIQNIILTGGGASLYQAAITDKFQNHSIKVMKDPVFSNVRGFQLAGEHQVIAHLRKTKKNHANS